MNAVYDLEHYNPVTAAATATATTTAITIATAITPSPAGVYMTTTSYFSTSTAKITSFTVLLATHAASTP